MNIREKVLVIEDEKSISYFISTVLNNNGYESMQARSGSEALSMISSHCPDLIILDLGLPDMDGIALIKAIREWFSIPIVVVSARDHERNKVAALDMGADDYITKPFGTGELLARIRTALRHAWHRSNMGGEASHVFTTGGLRLDYDLRRVEVDGTAVHLTQIEYKILALLCKYAGRVLTYDFILNNIWGPFNSCDNQILRVNMANIRRKLEKNPAEPRYIFTEIGVGYRMIDPD